MTTNPSPNATWTAPGPGSWVNDRSHAAPAPSILFRRIVSEHTAPVYRQVFEEFGGAVGTIDMQFVNGAMYRRLVPLIAPDRDKGKVPPNFVLWLASRLHPELRRRERTAKQVLADRSFMADVDHWATTERFEWIEANRVRQAVDVGSLDDGQLADHLHDLDQRLIAGWYRHHRLHANDLGPIGDLLVHAEGWGLDLVAVMRLLKGSSPATVETARFGRTIAEALRAAGVDPTSITDRSQIEAVPAAARALADYLQSFGWRLVSDYDITGLTLHELPSAVVAIVARSTEGHGEEEAAATETERARIALRAEAGDPELFDTLLADARKAYGVRDDNGPLTWSWPAGLTRRAYLEAGRRLHGSGALNEPDHVFEADIDEVRAMLGRQATDGAEPPTAADLDRRAEHRRWESGLLGPDVLGPQPPVPDVSPLPPGLRRLMGITLAAVTMIDPELDPAGEQAPLTGLGIGSEPYRGTARVVTDAGQAIDALQPGDILVAPYTAPSFNAVFAIAGGVVVQEGGLLCHAAVMARELGIPAVIGCRRAMTSITDGDQIEVDPVSGSVRVLAPA